MDLRAGDSAVWRKMVIEPRTAKLTLEETISLMQHLFLAVEANDPDLAKLASGALVKIGDAARVVAEQAVQLHSGMGRAIGFSSGMFRG